MSQAWAFFFSVPSDSAASHIQEGPDRKGEQGSNGIGLSKEQQQHNYRPDDVESDP
jgi:hypothetical protein